MVQHLYQDLDELLAQDAAASGLQVVSKNQELEQLVRKSLSHQLAQIMRWSAKDHETPAKTHDANQLVKSVDELVGKAHQKRRLAVQEATELKSLLKTRIHQSVGVRNESVAIEQYERLQGCQVGLRNAHFYYLLFPEVHPAKWDESRMTRHVSEEQDNDEAWDEHATRFDSDAFFTICGKVDGVTDALEIVAPSAENQQEEWRLVPIVVEVKNRLRAFRQPLPLHDHIQLAVYMKMLNVTDGDLVECINDGSCKPALRITRVALALYPLNAGLPGCRGEGDLWNTVIVPRLYAYTELLRKFRSNASLRVAFLLSSPEEQHAVLRAECDFL